MAEELRVAEVKRRVAEEKQRMVNAERERKRALAQAAQELAAHFEEEKRRAANADRERELLKLSRRRQRSLRSKSWSRELDKRALAKAAEGRALATAARQQRAVNTKRAHQRAMAELRERELKQEQRRVATIAARERAARELDQWRAAEVAARKRELEQRRAAEVAAHAELEKRRVAEIAARAPAMAAAATAVAAEEEKRWRIRREVEQRRIAKVAARERAASAEAARAVLLEAAVDGHSGAIFGGDTVSSTDSDDDDRKYFAEAIGTTRFPSVTPRFVREFEQRRFADVAARERALAAVTEGEEQRAAAAAASVRKQAAHDAARSLFSLSKAKLRVHSQETVDALMTSEQVLKMLKIILREMTDGGTQATQDAAGSLFTLAKAKLLVHSQGSGGAPMTPKQVLKLLKTICTKKKKKKKKKKNSMVAGLPARAIAFGPSYRMLAYRTAHVPFSREVHAVRADSEDEEEEYEEDAWTSLEVDSDSDSDGAKEQRIIVASLSRAWTHSMNIFDDDSDADEDVAASSAAPLSVAVAPMEPFSFATVVSPKDRVGTRTVHAPKNSYAMYEDVQNNTWVRVKVMKVHIGDPRGAFFTIMLPDGREKQTVLNRLRAAYARDEPAAETVVAVLASAARQIVAVLAPAIGGGGGGGSGGGLLDVATPTPPPVSSSEGAVTPAAAVPPPLLPPAAVIIVGRPTGRRAACMGQYSLRSYPGESPPWYRRDDEPRRFLFRGADNHWVVSSDRAKTSGPGEGGSLRSKSASHSIFGVMDGASQWMIRNALFAGFAVDPNIRVSQVRCYLCRGSWLDMPH